ncbi:hypothetical protein JMJ77_0014389, partial [Colletotrichum scovillei]
MPVHSGHVLAALCNPCTNGFNCIAWRTGKKQRERLFETTTYCGCAGRQATHQPTTALIVDLVDVKTSGKTEVSGLDTDLPELRDQVTAVREAADKYRDNGVAEHVARMARRRPRGRQTMSLQQARPVIRRLPIHRNGRDAT